MKISIKLLGLPFAMAALFTACSSDDDVTDKTSVNGKHPVMLSSNVQLNNNATRTLGDGTGSEVKFDIATQIALSMKSEKKNGTATDVKTVPNTTATVTTEVVAEPRTKVTFTADETRYWDDLYGRDAQLTVYAVGVQGKTVANLKDATDGCKNTLALDTDNKITWNLSTTQTTKSYELEDLLVSNNNRKVSDTKDDRMVYNNGFPTGNLLFRHATSKIIVNIATGTGISTTEFKNLSLKVNGFFVKGKMDASNGSFDVSSSTVSDITPIRLTTPNKINETTSYNYSYECLVIPSRDLDVDNQIFTITNTDNNNVYNIKTDRFNQNSTISDKLTGNIEAGKQYIFNITLNKTGIELTASKKDWDTQSPDGLTPVIVKGSGIGTSGIGGKTNELTKFDLYRSTSLATGYDNNTTTTDAVDYATTVTYGTDGFTCSPDIYWPDHTTPYYFRALGELDESGNATDTHVEVVSAEGKDYVAISTCKEESGKYTKDGSDICMGAPYTKTTSGATSTVALTEAKKAGDGNLNLTFNHGLAEVYVQLLTNTADGATDAINLTNAVVEIENSVTTGKYMLETAAVVAGTTRTDSYSMGSAYAAGTTLPGSTTASAGNYYRCYVVPQALNFTKDDAAKYITFKITCTEADGKKNIFYVDTRNVQVTSDGTSTFTTEWKAGNRYVYNITLLKSKIDVKATLIDWATNVITNGDVKL